MDELLYQTSYLGFYINVFSYHVEFKGNKGGMSLPIAQIADVQVAGPLLWQITILTTDGQKYRVPTSRKQEAAAAIMQARTNHPNVQNAPNIPVAGVPIDNEIQRVKLAIQDVSLQLRQVNANMASERSHYQQNHLHGGGKIGGVIRSFERGGKDARLRKQQPMKEQLQQQKLVLEQELNQLKTLKARGVAYVRTK